MPTKKAAFKNLPPVIGGIEASLAAKADAAHLHTGVYQAVSEKGVADGYAGLGVDGKVPSAQLPVSTGGIALSDVYQVGDIYITTSAINPLVRLGFGVWLAFGAGRVLVGIDPLQTEFDTVEKTGGAKTHTLTTAEMPVHTHVQTAHTHLQNAHTHVQNAHSHIITSQTATTGGATSYEHGTLDTSSAETEATETTATATAVNQDTTAVNQDTTAVNQNAGGGTAHNNLQPYIVVYMWKRTA